MKSPTHQDGGEAFGAPGIAPRWTSSSKEGVGTAYNASSRIWFTLSHGIVNEIYHPCIDQPNTRDIQLLVTDGETFVHEERCDFEHELSYPEKGALAHRIVNHSPDNRYEIRKTVITDPYLPVLLIDHEIVVHDDSLAGKLRFFLLLAPHLKGKGEGNTAQIIDFNGTPLLHAHRDGTHLACGCLPPFSKASAGFAGHSDGYQDLVQHRSMEWTFQRATNGNVALTAEIQPDAGGRFLIAIGLGSSLTSAITPMAQSLALPFASSFDRFVRQWSRMRHEEDENESLVRHTGDGGSLYRLSRCILQAHEDKLFQGSLIASMSIPWGDSKNDEDLGGYHLVWPRDMLHSASALLVSGQRELPLRALIYLACIQQDDGSMPQNCWIDGTPYWTGRQLDETAAPVMLASRLQQAGALQDFDPWILSSRAISYLMLNGPSTGQERWEENSGYSPSTLAAILAAVVAGSTFAANRNDTESRQLLLEYADWIHSNLEVWTCTSHGSLDPTIPRHFVRLIPPSTDHIGPAGDPAEVTIEIANGGGTRLASEIIDAGFLELVRLGFIAADHPLVVDSLKLVDRELKVVFDGDPCWRRYSFDGYGSHRDGSGFDGTGYGGCWPLLTGERAHYELSAGGSAVPFLRAMENFANEGGMIPEQIWPLEDAGHLRHGGPAGSAMPLCWAHAEYISLVHSAKLGFPHDRIPEAWVRYVENPAPEVRTQFWSLCHRTPQVRAGSRVVVLLDHSGKLKWRADDADDWTEVDAVLRFGNLHTAELGKFSQHIEFSLDDDPGRFRISSPP